MLLLPTDIASQMPFAELDRHLVPQAVTDSDPWRDYDGLLRHAKLRPTRQRLALAWILFSKRNRHVTAEMLHEEALKAKIQVSRATVYNNLHQFTDAGLVQQVAVDGTKAFFDTNTMAHHHFFLIGEHALVDIPAANVALGKVPEAPEGYEIVRVDVVVRIRRKRHRLK